MYGAADEGGVTLQLRDVDDLDSKSSLASVLAQLQEEDAAALSISYTDDSLANVLLDSNFPSSIPSTVGASIDTSTLDLFDSENAQDLTLSPQTFTSSTEAFINNNSDCLTDSAEDSTGASDASRLVVIKSRPKASSPNRQGPQQCQVCGKVFGNASALAKHRLTHSDERKYVCSMCTKAFKRQDHLNGHMLTHRSKKPYECKADGCGKSYCDARSLRRHTENHHSCSNSSTPTSPDAQSSFSSCIQFAPPPPTPPPASTPPLTPLSPSAPVNAPPPPLKAPSQLQQLLASEPISSSSIKSISVSDLDPKPAVSSASASSTPSSGSSSADNSTSTTPPSKTDPKPVECNLCHRSFKNFPALNGHMRLHGGYFKKDSDCKKSEKRESSGPPLQTASISVRALIEEKIIQKRNTNPALSLQNQTNVSTSSSESVKFISSTQSSISKSSQSNDKGSSSFIISVAPSQQDQTQATQKAWKTNFTPLVLTSPKEKSAKDQSSSSNAQNRKLKRESSDPSSPRDPPKLIKLPEKNLIRIKNGSLPQFTSNGGVSELANADGFSHKTFLLQDINSFQQQLNNATPQETISNTIPDSKNNNHQNKEIQSLLKTILPVSLSDLLFQSNPTKKSDVVSPASSCSTINQTVNSMTISASESSAVSVPSMNSMTIHAPTVVRPGLQQNPAQVVTVDSLQNVVCFPPSSVPTPLSSSSITVPLSSIIAPFSNQSLQSQLMTNSDDPLLSSCPKDFSSRKRFDLQTLKLLSNGKMDILSSNAQNLAEVLLNCNCEVKFIQVGSSFKSIKDLTKTSAVVVKTENATSQEIKTEDAKVGTRDVKLCSLLDGTSSIFNGNQQSLDSPLPSPTNKSPFTYTPYPILNSALNGTRVYSHSSPWPNLRHKGGSNGQIEAEKPAMTPHINVGFQFQAEVPPVELIPDKFSDKDAFDVLLWDPYINEIISNKELDMFLEFACCACIQGGGRNKECALHILYLCHGNIQEAMLKLMQPTASLFSCYPFMTQIKYPDDERWTSFEIDLFHRAITLHKKDFPAVSKLVGSKSVKQCIQFYYMWKKSCAQEYRKLKLESHKNGNSENDVVEIKVEPETLHVVL
ncbi:uncharacterized protein [Bemisia tabaci]|uniref:uncharacterized protein isoform X1 n=1 Tax=Bemisia tabaci TaxID=7038 RepID=UPI003B27BC7E